MVAENDAALRADLQQFYNIDLDHAMDGGHSVAHVAALVSQLPQGARLVSAYRKDSEWTLTAILQAVLINKFSMFVWGMADKKKRGPKPKLIGPSWMVQPQMQSLPAQAMPINQLMSELQKPRKQRG